MMLPAVISLRVSTDEQAEEGYSLAAQERACRAFCEAQGWPVVAVVADEGVSGTLPPSSRPGLSAALDMLRRGSARALVVHKLDRLARSVRITNDLIDEFQRRGIAFVAVADRIDLSTPFGWAAFQMQNVWNELYIKNLSFETKKGHREKATKGLWVGPVPYGYERDGKTLVPSKDAPVVALIFEWYATGLESYMSIADRLNTAGYRTYNWQTHERGLFGRESVRTILQNRAYLGYVSSGGVEYQGVHPPLVPADLWECCAAIRGERTRDGVFMVRPEGGEILTRLVYCADCGSRMHRIHSGRTSSRTVRYRCSGSRAAGVRHRDCRAPMALAEPIESRVLALLRSMCITPELRAILKEEAQAAIETHQLDRPQNDHAQALRELKRLFLNDELSAAEYDSRRAALLVAQEEQAAVAGPDLQMLLGYLSDIPALLRAASRDEVRALVRPVLSHVWVQDRGVVAVTPTAVFEPLLVGVWRAEVERRCLTGISDLLTTSSISLWHADRAALIAA